MEMNMISLANTDSLLIVCYLSMMQAFSLNPSCLCLTSIRERSDLLELPVPRVLTVCRECLVREELLESLVLKVTE